MIWNRSISCVVLAYVLLFSAPAHAQLFGEAAGPGEGKNIRSLKEIRGEGVVRQRWDMSCGAAALSTLLTYDFKDKTPETAIVVWLLHRVDPARVRARGGFSLLDLKHFAQARGYQAEGFSGMTIRDLAMEKMSVITPIRLKGFDHFVVVRGVEDGRVLIADPGFGNLTMRVDRFQQLWKNGVVFIVHPPDERMIPPKNERIASRMIPDETVITRGIGVSIPANPLY
jgi:hypothetical protein